jgi:hypothetical protein
MALDGYQAVAGIDWVSGEKVADWERLAAFAGLMWNGVALLDDVADTAQGASLSQRVVRQEEKRIAQNVDEIGDAAPGGGPFGGTDEMADIAIGGKILGGTDEMADAAGGGGALARAAQENGQEPIRALALYGEVELPYDPSTPLLARGGISDRVANALYEPLPENGAVAVRYRPPGAERYDRTANYRGSGLIIKGSDILPEHIKIKRKNGLRLVEKDGKRYWVLSDLDLGGVAIDGELLGLRSPDLKTMDRVVKSKYGDLVNEALGPNYKLIMHGGGGIVHPKLEVIMEQGAWDTEARKYLNPDRVTSMLNERVLVLRKQGGQRFISDMPYRQFLRQYAPKGLPDWVFTGDLPIPP